MPTAAEFDSWATELETMRDDLSTVNRVTPDHAPRTIMRGTENEQSVITAVEQITGNASSASIHLGALATLCRDRARACAWYTDLYRDWERDIRRYGEVAAVADGFMGSPPRQPSKPGAWAEVG